MTKIKRSKIMSKCYLCESTENVLKIKEEYLCESCRNHIVLRSLIFKEKRQSRLKAYIIGILGTLSAFGFKLLTYIIN